MSEVTMVFALVTGSFLVVASGAGAVIRFLMAENRQLRNELVLGYRRATMPVLGVPDVGEPDVPLTPAIKKAIDEAYGIESVVEPYTPDRFDAQMYPDPTDGLLPNPDPTDGANRVSYGDDPFWPVQSQDR